MIIIRYICTFTYAKAIYLETLTSDKKTGRKSSILATQRQGLLQLFSLGLVGHDQSVKVPAAPGNAGEIGWQQKSMQAMHPSKMMVPLLIDFCGTRFCSYMVCLNYIYFCIVYWLFSIAWKQFTMPQSLILNLVCAPFFLIFTSEPVFKRFNGRRPKWISASRFHEFYLQNRIIFYITGKSISLV